jgi:glucose/arabinose dehydrogenase
VEVAEIESPLALASRAGDDALYIASQPGKVFAIRAGTEPTAVLDITSEVKSGGEQGLLGLAFSTDGSTAYVNYTLADDSIQVEAFAVTDGGTFDLTSRTVIINIEHPNHSNHNGGHLAIGPDGMLYIGVGDGGGSGDPDRNALDLSSPLGKILRIDPRAAGDSPYTVPADNPFAGNDSRRAEIWAYGLRNPWRFSFDRLTGDLWVGDVGERRVEEVNVARVAEGAGKGANFGWSAYEGSDRFNKDQQAKDRITPIYEYRHHDKSASVTGGFVYRGTAIPGLYGAYVFGDAVIGTVWALRPDDEGKAIVAKVGYVSAVSSFGEDNAGELYALSLGDDKVYRITQAS